MALRHAGQIRSEGPRWDSAPLREATLEDAFRAVDGDALADESGKGEASLSLFPLLRKDGLAGLVGGG